MVIKIEKPSIIEAAGTKSKIIEEFIGIIRCLFFPDKRKNSQNYFGIEIGKL
jgi:hypothetical protein